MIDLNLIDVALRIFLAVIFGGVVGYDREIKGQSAGFRTHMLVAMGATIIALIQIQATNEILDIAAGNSDYIQIISVDHTRLTAQIVSGIGFLGAGAIIVTKRSVSGLTTAASIWATAGIGIAVGMGYYGIALIGTFMIVIVLALIKNKLKIAGGENLVIHYLNKQVRERVIGYFDEHQINYFSAEFRIENKLEQNYSVYTEHFVIKIPPGSDISEVIQDVSEIDSVIYASTQHNII